jgi:Protoglobin
MSDHTPTSEAVIEHPEHIPGYTYGTDEAATSPLSLQDLERLKEAVWLTPEDKQALREAAEILADQADDMVTVWRARLRDLPFMRPYSGHPDGTPNPEYGAATKPRFDRFIIDACTRPLDQDWLNYQQEIGLRHTRAKKNLTDHADSLNHIPLRYLLAFTAVVVATSRDYLAAKGASPESPALSQRIFTARLTSSSGAALAGLALVRVLCLTSLTFKARRASSGRTAAALPVACGTERTLILMGDTTHSRLSPGREVMLAARPASCLGGRQHRRRR